MMKRCKLFCLICLACTMMLGLIACQKKAETDPEDGSYRIYYINSSSTGMVTEYYKAESTDTEDIIEELVGVLCTDSGTYGYKKAISDDISLKGYEYNDEELILNFDASYSAQSTINEVLTRAAVVKTLTQIKGVEYIQFQVNGQPLMDSYDLPVGIMTKDDFIDDSDVETTYIPAEITLYFADESGEKLVACDEKEYYDGSLTVEQLIMSCLIEGPNDEDLAKGIQPVIPEGTMVNDVTTKEGICYIDLSSEFLNKLDGISEQATIYAVVNSLVELSNINKVQLMIDGKTQKTYRESGIAFDGIFERNLNIIEGAN